MAVYTGDLNVSSSATNKAYVDEQHLYGASRLGMRTPRKLLYTSGAAVIDPTTSYYVNTLGKREYEISNYLGNVNAVITDRKTYLSGGYLATVIARTDYYAFGMQMPLRTFTSDKYRYGYNGMEKDDQVKGVGNSYTTEFRQYDPRLGRWLSPDPLSSWAPGWNPYRFGFDNPVLHTDETGLFETKKEARQYKRENGLGGKIRENENGTFSIYDKKAATIYTKATHEDWSQDPAGNNINKDGVATSTYITPSKSPKAFLLGG